MKYSIYIGGGLFLKVCIARFDNFADAKAKMADLIVDLISSTNNAFDGWNEFKEKFPFGIQRVIDSYEEYGVTCYCDDMDNSTDTFSYSIYDDTFEIESRGSENTYDYSIKTNTFNMDDPDQNYSFALTKRFPSGERELIIDLLVNDGEVQVYNVIPDEVRSRLGVIDLDDE